MDCTVVVVPILEFYSATADNPTVDDKPTGQSQSTVHPPGEKFLRTKFRTNTEHIITMNLLNMIIAVRDTWTTSEDNP